ncbi:aminotransferase class I/II-fold pyridoxal phosphate-dependent enzyme [Breoghania sp.]|uniref:aminotransferase class I/II-fold pyridoxal phosphate-dependent enzyme n=1 Tax=Breoghania sp. TaxID=2065378 RepID=UPI00261DF777|nr:aminotransferase class I/II-fold pyridoxal phosphate-dependent enzyme [Breoghania sp.]MDJ0930782.1 aminotransferase class I/II-fold pyridoxal phosphate-dependent enzyme [Breoghania sp.]
MLSAARDLKKRGGLLIVDEAFADVTPEISVLPHIGDEPIAVLRSFGKFFGLAGLRLGFIAAQPPLAKALEACFGSWAISGPALSIGRAAITDIDWQINMRARLQREAAVLDDVLRNDGLKIIGGTSLFRLTGHRDAFALHYALAQRRIWTRQFDDHSTWLRIGLPGSRDACVRLADALAAAQRNLAG